MFERIYDIDNLELLRKHLTDLSDYDRLRENLFAEFLKHSRYRNAEEWNKAVRLCECLAIVGWGEHEPVEAIKGVYFNGNPNTFFVNRNAEPRYFDAVWSKRKDGLAIDFSLSSCHESPDAAASLSTMQDDSIGEIQAAKLSGQRNWIPKNPIALTRGLANCYDNSKALIESMEKDLMPALNRRMRPELYGSAVNRIIIDCSFSFYDNYHCKTNYIIADESLGLKPKDFYQALRGMYSEKEIEHNGYYLRNRFSFGPFRSDSGTIRVGIVLEKEFSDMTRQKQKETLSAYFLHAVGRCAERLSRKVNYDFGLMKTDFSAILREWCEM